MSGCHPESAPKQRPIALSAPLRFLNGLTSRAKPIHIETDIRSIYLIEYDLFAKLVSTFTDHALGFLITF